jgi:tRNA nucleotidyltransferase (CCA-adding enzyme)
MQLRIDDERVAQVVTTVCTCVRAAGGRAVVVGGSVRDAALGKAAHDVDIEVYGIAADALDALLAARFRVDRVGKAFGVIKIRGLPIDISVPRRESKAGLGHKGFIVGSDPYLSVTEAASRRDYTINAVSLDPLTGEVIDPFGGLEDLRRRILRHTSDKFAEDPLRVLRGVQFAARFDLAVADETVALARTIEPEGLAAERVWDEWRKLILWGERPSRGLWFLAACGWVRHFPELAALIGCAQEPEWHPEGDVWVHTLACMDAFAEERIGVAEEDLIVGCAVLCHDFGKPATTTFEDGRIRSRKHDHEGEAPTRAFLARLTNSEDFIDAVVTLVVNHLRPQQLYDQGAGDTAIRRLARSVGRIDRLVRVARADRCGRPGAPPDDFPEGVWLLARAHELAVADSAPQPLVMGRHLIDLGLVPGPHFRAILDTCYEAQLDGVFTDPAGGIAFAREVLDERAAGDGSAGER